MIATMPIVLAGSMAVSMHLTGPVEPVDTDRDEKPRESKSSIGDAIKDAFVAAGTAVATTTSPAAHRPAAVPSSYRVAAGDTVSSIAGRFGLSTASVLALNGLGWKSVIFPGQVLKLSSAATSAPAPAPAPAPSSAGRYTIAKGDTVSRIAQKFGVPVASVLSANGLSWSSIIYPGQTLTIPGQAAPAATPVTPVVSTPVVSAPPASSTYTIKSGDTIGAIAARHGVSTQALLSANGLSWSSVIYAGRTLTIPGTVATTPAVHVTPVATPGKVTPMTAEMRANAQVIVRVGQQLGVSEYGLVIALATAMQESSLRNLDHGDRDSIGLFQQRPSTGWGTKAQLMDAAHAARLFYGGPSNPNKGVTRGLLDIRGWQSMSVTQAAQAVQISAYPDAYAKWETSARAWLAELR
ncbi:LysM peptidoglycan-binding domain-containing protein [Diaminobutyricimonas aerilata]